MNPFEWMDYCLLRLRYRLHYNKIVLRLKIECEFWNIDRRLRRMGASSEKILDVMIRYASRRKTKTELETRESIILLGNAMAELSEKTGIPQWKLRVKIKEDFNIDL